MKKIETSNLIELSVNEQKNISGGEEKTLVEKIWYGIGYLFGANYKIHKYHAETAPWVGQGSK